MTREEAIEMLKALNMMLRSPDGKPISDACAALDMAIEALQAQPTHGRLIDADALSKKLCETTIFIKDGEVFQRMINDAPTVQADRPHGEWVTVNGLLDVYICDQCGEIYQIQNIPMWNFCPNCGADM